MLAEGREDDERVRDYMRQIADLDGVTDTSMYAEDLPPEVTVIDFEPVGEATGERAQELVREIRALDADFEVLVGGPAAETVDTIDGLPRLPIAIGMIAIATFGLLFALTRSLIVPLKALLLNAAVIAATLGAITVLYRLGLGREAARLRVVGRPRCDNHCSRRRNAFIRPGDGLRGVSRQPHPPAIRKRDPGESAALANRRAVMEGLVRSAPVMVTAAVSIGIVFAGFSLSALQSMKEAGIGLLLAIVMDGVTILRLLLLPATIIWARQLVARDSSRTGPGRQIS